MPSEVPVDILLEDMIENLRATPWANRKRLFLLKAMSVSFQRSDTTNGVKNVNRIHTRQQLSGMLNGCLVFALQPKH